MLGEPKNRTNTVKILDEIEREIFNAIKSFGFTKHGHTLHRFVSEDISQVINFQLGQAYLDATHLLSVNIGIRVPKCMVYSFDSETKKKKYYQEYDCNLRSRLGTVEGREESCYDLHCQSAESIVADILRQLQETVLPTFEILSTREAIFEKRRDYPDFDKLNSHLILLEEAMIYRHLGNKSKAEEEYNAYLRELIKTARESDANIIARKGWLIYALELADKLGVSVSSDNQNQAKAFLDGQTSM